jgi:hypothetical protein
MKENASCKVKDPTAFVAVTSVKPRAQTGVSQVMMVSDTTVTALAGDPPKFTPVVRSSPVPVMVTLVPPAMFPATGDIERIDGKVSGRNWTRIPVDRLPVPS